MPMSVVYATVNGRMVQENRGGTITKYVADTLGSVIQTRNAAGVETSSTTYWPYGEARTSTGTNPSPWGFVGTLGYFRDALTRLYIRARYYIASIGRWNTVDPLWPAVRPYMYASNKPASDTDPTGLLPANVIAALIAGLTSCAASAIGSVVTGWFSGDSPPVAICKAAIKCLANGLRSALTALFGPLAGCLLGILSALAGLAADKLCPCISNPCCDKNPNWCDAAKAVADAATACLGGFANQEFRDALGDWFGGAINQFINTVTRGAAGRACTGAVDLKKYW